MMTRPDLTDTEVDELCSGLRQNAAKCRYLEGLGLTVHTRPNGRPLVWRAHAEHVLSGHPAASQPTKDTPRTTAQPNRAGLVLLLGRKTA
jgi:hypothetical protein